MELTDSLKALFVHTAQSLQGSARRLFMARTVKELGPGGQRQAERELGWNRGTLRNLTLTPARYTTDIIIDKIRACGIFT